jgi:Na+/H+-dicarboxylate symporter
LNPVIPLMFSIVLAVLIGEFSLKLVDPVNLQILSHDILTPLFDAFMRLMGLLAGVIVFLQHALGYRGYRRYGLSQYRGQTAGRPGAALDFRYSGGDTGGGFVVLPVDFYGAVNGAGIVKQLWKLLLDIVPGDIASPFLKGNSLQIIFLAVCSGLIMAHAGQTDGKRAHGCGPD